MIKLSCIIRKNELRNVNFRVKFIYGFTNGLFDPIVYLYSVKEDMYPYYVWSKFKCEAVG